MGPFGEPISDQLGLVSGRVVHDDMNVEIGRYVFLDLVQERLEFGRPVTRHALSDESADLHVECRNNDVVPCRL